MLFFIFDFLLKNDYKRHEKVLIHSRELKLVDNKSVPLRLTPLGKQSIKNRKYH